MKDCHVHTKISHDGISTIDEYLNAAKEKGVDEIAFTEHYDIYEGKEVLVRGLFWPRIKSLLLVSLGAAVVILAVLVVGAGGNLLFAVTALISMI